jgi:hypothetical protein
LALRAWEACGNSRKKRNKTASATLPEEIT